jgi:hypothetical protein
MLPQFGPREGKTADKLRMSTKRILLKRRMQQGRGEIAHQGQRNKVHKDNFLE